WMNAPYLVSDQDWSSFEQWTRTLGTDPTPFLREFQEVSVPLDLLRAVPKVKGSADLSFVVNKGSTPNESHVVEFRWNGQDWKPGDPTPLREGENLLLVTKTFKADA